MKIPKNIEHFDFLITTTDSFERINEMIDAINFLLDRVRKEDVENAPFEMNLDNTEKALKQVKEDAKAEVIQEISEMDYCEFCEHDDRRNDFNYCEQCRVPLFQSYLAKSLEGEQNERIHTI